MLETFGSIDPDPGTKPLKNSVSKYLERVLSITKTNDETPVEYDELTKYLTKRLKSSLIFFNPEIHNQIISLAFESYKINCFYNIEQKKLVEIFEKDFKTIISYFGKNEKNLFRFYIYLTRGRFFPLYPFGNTRQEQIQEMLQEILNIKV